MCTLELESFDDLTELEIKAQALTWLLNPGTERLGQFILNRWRNYKRDRPDIFYEENSNKAIEKLLKIINN